MFGFLANITKGEKLALIGAFIIILLLVLISVSSKLEREDDRANQQVGAQAQQNTNLNESLKRTETGNEARSQIESAVKVNGGRDPAVHAQCLRTARTPANCARYAVPERPADQR